MEFQGYLLTPPPTQLYAMLCRLLVAAALTTESHQNTKLSEDDLHRLFTNKMNRSDKLKGELITAVAISVITHGSKKLSEIHSLTQDVD